MLKIRMPYGGELEEIMSTPDIPIEESDSEVEHRKSQVVQEYKHRLTKDPRVRQKKKVQQKQSFGQYLKDELSNEWNRAKELLDTKK